MKPGYTERRKRQAVKAIVILTTIIAVSLLTWLFLRITHILPSNRYALTGTDSVISVQQNNVLMQDEILHNHLNALHKLDEEYTSKLTASSDAANDGLADLNAKITSEEDAFGKSIDSISKQMPSFPNKINESFFVNMIMSFRSTLQNRRSISNLRNAISKNNNLIDPAEKSLMQLQNELLAKDTRIANLETELKTLQNAPVVKPQPIPAGNKEPVSNSAIAQENTSLKEKVTDSENKLASLTAINASLKKDYDRVAKQLSDAAAAPNTDQAAAKTKNTSLENKVDELNTELSLAQVDCNLSRVDAKQIISNAKQRKVLLSEALSILNNLSKSKNTTVQKKVREKIDRLNEIATNSRD